MINNDRGLVCILEITSRLAKLYYDTDMTDYTKLKMIKGMLNKYNYIPLLKLSLPRVLFHNKKAEHVASLLNELASNVLIKYNRITSLIHPDPDADRKLLALTKDYFEEFRFKVSLIDLTELFKDLDDNKVNDLKLLGFSHSMAILYPGGNINLLNVPLFFHTKIPKDILIMSSSYKNKMLMSQDMIYKRYYDYAVVYQPPTLENSVHGLFRRFMKEDK